MVYPYTHETVRRIKAPVWAVWRCWAEHDLLVKWMAPEPVRVEIREYDPVPGGALHLTMHMPDGEQFPSDSTILMMEPEKRIVFTNMFAPGFVPDPRGSFCCDVTMEQQGDETLYIARVHCKDEDTYLSNIRTGLPEAWNTMIDSIVQMAQSIAAKAA